MRGFCWSTWQQDPLNDVFAGGHGRAIPLQQGAWLMRRAGSRQAEAGSAVHSTATINIHNPVFLFQLTMRVASTTIVSISRKDHCGSDLDHAAKFPKNQIENEVVWHIGRGCRTMLLTSRAVFESIDYYRSFMRAFRGSAVAWSCWGPDCSQDERHGRCRHGRIQWIDRTRA